MTRGGAERVAATLSNAWAARGDEVFLIPTRLPAAEPEYPLHAGVRFEPLAAVMETAAGKGGVIAKFRGLRRMIRTLDPDVVVSFLTNVNVTALVALPGLRAPLVISERVDPAASIEMPYSLRLARKLLYQFADTLVVQTAAASMRYRGLLLRPPATVVIPNPLPAPLQAATERATATDAAEGGDIVAIGRLTPQKRFDVLIRAFARAFASGTAPWTLSIWGEGPLREPLQQLIRDSGLDGRVRLCGPTDDPWAVLAGAQMFALSSMYEGFPNAMLEAMALGVPCVAFDCPSGPRELALDGELAVLIRNGDEDALAEALQSLAADRERRVGLGRAGAESARVRFAEGSVLAAWDELFQRLCG